MCKITNTETIELLKNLRNIDDKGIKNIGKGVLSDSLISINVLTDELKKYTDSLKKEAIKRDINLTFYPNVERKIEILTGRESAVFDTVKIGKKFVKENRLNDFFKIVKIQSKQIDTEISKSDSMITFIEKNIEYTTGEKTCSVKKMTKLEIKEYKE